jgi:F-box-like
MFFLSIDLMCRGTIGAAENGEYRVSCEVEENDVVYSRPPKTKWVQGYLYESFSAVGLLPRLYTKHYLAPSSSSMITDMAGIYDLPNELILHIVSYIKDHSTLRGLSLVSITFNRISTASTILRESEETNALLDGCLSGVSYGSFLQIPGSPT